MLYPNSINYLQKSYPENFHIKPKRPTLHKLHIELNILWNQQFFSTIHLHTAYQSKQQLIYSIFSRQNKKSPLIKQCRTWSYKIIHSFKIENNCGNSFRLLQRSNSSMGLRKSSGVVISLVRKEWIYNCIV